MLARTDEMKEAGLIQTSDEAAVLHDFDVRPPVLVLAQANNSDKYPNTGEIYRIDTGESFAELRVIPFMVQPTRSKLPAGPYQKDRRPECISLDGVRPLPVLPFSGEASLWYAKSAKEIKGLTGGNVDKAEHMTCATCPFKAADPYSTPRDQGYCFAEYAAMLMDIETGEGYVTTLRSTNTRIGRVLGNRANYRKRIVTLSSEHVKGDKGNYYRLVAHADREDAPEDLSEMARGLVSLYNVNEAAGAEYVDYEKPASNDEQEQEGGEDDHPPITENLPW